MSTSFIMPSHVRAFQAVTTQLYGEVTLASCLLNGKPGVAIVLVEYAGEGKVSITPLFVAITEDMQIDFGGESESSGGGGGPRRSFKEAKDSTRTASCDPK